MLSYVDVELKIHNYLESFICSRTVNRDDNENSRFFIKALSIVQQISTEL